MKKIILITVLFTLLFPIFMIQGEGERWEHILTTDYFVYTFDKLSLKTSVAEGSSGKCLDVWLKYQYQEPAIAELLIWAKQRNMPKEDIEYTKNLDYMLIHVLLSPKSEKLELESITYDKNGIPVKLDPASGEWRVIVPGSVNEYLFMKVWEYAAGHNPLFKNNI
jgi:hypothetical protein